MNKFLIWMFFSQNNTGGRNIKLPPRKSENASTYVFKKDNT